MNGTVKRGLVLMACIVGAFVAVPPIHAQKLQVTDVGTPATIMLEGVLVSTKRPVSALKIRAINYTVRVMVTEEAESRLELVPGKGKFSPVKYGFLRANNTLYFEEAPKENLPRSRGPRGPHSVIEFFKNLFNAASGGKASGSTLNVYIAKKNRLENMEIQLTNGSIVIEEATPLTVKRATLRTVNGDIKLNALNGDIAIITTVSGDISVRNASFRKITPTATSGNISFDSLNGTCARASTVSGKIAMRNMLYTEIYGSATSGGITLDTIVGDLMQISTVSGNIILRNTNVRKISGTATSGNISLSPVKFSGRAVRINATATSGRLRMHVNEPGMAINKLGKLTTVTLPSKSGSAAYVSVDLKAVSGAITVNN